MKFIFLLLLLFYTSSTWGQKKISHSVVNKSRNSTVKVINGNSNGTGFFISDDLIVTNFHVISSSENKNMPNSSIQIISNSGESINAKCISIPNEQSKEPLIYDFAILRIEKKIHNKSILKFPINYNYKIPDEVIFSGYPVNLNILLSHTGIISGILEDWLIYIQSSINKGNSGGAVIDSHGNAIGIITFRTGGITNNLSKNLNILNKNTQSDETMEFFLGDIELLQNMKDEINILNEYTNIGIGSAISTYHVKKYIKDKNIKI